jgi:hypothetical protein
MSYWKKVTITYQDLIQQNVQNGAYFNILQVPTGYIITQIVVRHTERFNNSQQQMDPVYFSLLPFNQYVQQDPILTIGVHGDPNNFLVRAITPTVNNETAPSKCATY